MRHNDSTQAEGSIFLTCPKFFQEFSKIWKIARKAPVIHLIFKEIAAM